MVFQKGHNAWNKGLTKETDERLKKIGEKISKSMKGKIPWNKGLTKETDERIKSSWNKGLTKETDEKVRKIGEKLKGRVFTEETINRMSKSQKGKHHTEEAKRKMSKTREGCIPWNKGLTKETDERIKSPWNKGLSSWNKGLTKETDKRIQKYGEKLKGRIFSEETRKKMSDAKDGYVPWNKGLTKETDERIKTSWINGLTKETDNRVKKMGESISKGRLKRKQELGYLISPEARKKQGKAISGINNPNYGKTGVKSHLYGTHHSEETIIKMRESALKGENHPNWNPNRKERYAPYGENFYNKIIRNRKWNMQNGRDMLTGTILDPEKKPAYHHIDYIKSNDDPDNHCFVSKSNHSRITDCQNNPIKSERYKRILQENTLALKNGEIPKNWSPLNKELFRQEKLRQLDLSSYII